MAGSLVTQKKFSIDDAFEENYDDVIRIYGSTTERSPLKTKEKNIEVNDNVTVWVETPGQKRLHAPADDNTSKDSDSLIRYEGYPSEYDYDPSEPCWKHPKIKENWKMVVAASALLLIGICLFSIGIILATVSGIQALVFFIAGFICFVPGAYHVVYIYFAVKGKRGECICALMAHSLGWLRGVCGTRLAPLPTKPLGWPSHSLLGEPRDFLDDVIPGTASRTSEKICSLVLIFYYNYFKLVLNKV